MMCDMVNITKRFEHRIMSADLFADRSGKAIWDSLLAQSHYLSLENRLGELSVPFPTSEMFEIPFIHTYVYRISKLTDSHIGIPNGRLTRLAAHMDETVDFTEFLRNGTHARYAPCKIHVSN
jgi:hypothetical protein